MLSKDVILEADCRCPRIRPQAYVFIKLSITCTKVLANDFLANSFGSYPAIVRLLHILTYLITYLLTHLLTYLITYLFNYLLTHSLTHLLTYSLAHLLTYLLTPCRRVLEKLTGSQLVKKFPTFYGTRRVITILILCYYLRLGTPRSQLIGRLQWKWTGPNGQLHPWTYPVTGRLRLSHTRCKRKLKLFSVVFHNDVNY